MKVEQLMTKDVASCSPEESLNEAARIMWERDCGFVPITDGDAGRSVVGILTDRDVCLAAYFKGSNLKDVPIRTAMSTGIRACKPTDSISEVEATMRSAQIHRLPVVDDANCLLGVISLADIAREATREAGSDRREVTEAEIGDTIAAISRPRMAAAAG